MIKTLYTSKAGQPFNQYDLEDIAEAWLNDNRMFGAIHHTILVPVLVDYMLERVSEGHPSEVLDAIDQEEAFVINSRCVRRVTEVGHIEAQAPDYTLDKPVEYIE